MKKRLWSVLIVSAIFLPALQGKATTPPPGKYGNPNVSLPGIEWIKTDEIIMDRAYASDVCVRACGSKEWSGEFGEKSGAYYCSCRVKK